MRILQVIHQFPPYSSQGSEVYCHRLAKHLSASDDVRVFHISNVGGLARRLRREVFDGLETYHCIDRAEYSRLSDHPNHFLREKFQRVLSEWAPEVVHFHNYLSLGDDLVSLARASGAVVVYTLHDFGLICPNTFLLRRDGQLCGKDSGEFFQDCCPELIRTSASPIAGIAARSPSLARWKLFAKEQHRPVVSQALKGAVASAEWVLGRPEETRVPEKRDFFFTHTRRIFQDAHLFIAPSEFLRQRYIGCGLAPDKVSYLRYGMTHFARVSRREGSGRVRFGYIGALHAQKGIELLLSAFESVADRAELHVYGSAFGSPISETYWQRLHDRYRGMVTFHGRYENSRIGDILSTLDAVVVPSVWYENSPLTIQEAFIGGVPVITSDQGGMAELVRDGVDGLLFRLGDRGSLARKLAQAISDPAMLDRLRQNIPPVPDVRHQTDLVRRHYERLLAGPGRY